MSNFPCRIIIDPLPGSGAWNMAVDEALLTAAVERSQCAVRWYQWSEPTISLGHFQDAQAVARHGTLARLPVVRRLSGGGAILHHHELTYSCTVPASHPLARDAREIYLHVHRALIAVLEQFGCPVALRGESQAEKSGEFLCFGRGDAFDVVLGGYKVIGSAQRRRKGAVLQHGSLILRRSEWAPQFPGLRDLCTPGASLAAADHDAAANVQGTTSGELSAGAGAIASPSVAVAGDDAYLAAALVPPLATALAAVFGAVAELGPLPAADEATAHALRAGGRS